MSNYTGRCSITADVTVEAKTVNCDLIITAGKVTISRSKINGRIDVYKNGSLDITDSEVDGQNAQAPAIGFRNFNVTRSNIHSAKDAINCELNCLVRDSFLHVEYIPSGATWHMQAFLSNGGSDVTLLHNTLKCDVPITSNDGGCTANISIFGDFGPNHRYRFEDNYLMASTRMSYCAYGGTDPGKPFGRDVAGIVFRNNVFERGSNNKCGLYGPVTSFDRSASGNIWENNNYVDGVSVQP